MALPKLLTLVSGKIKAVAEAITSSAGAGDADKLIATDAGGKLDPSFLPAGVGASTVTVQATENLSAGDLVNIYTDTGNARCRKADGATLKKANGFVLAAVTSGNNATIYPLGELNSQHSGLTPGTEYFLSVTVPGGVQTAAPSTAGQLYQIVGVAVSATEMQTVADVAVEIG